MLLEIKNLSKQFGNVRALSDLSMYIAPGEVHGLVGENGAGKSTLIKILTGVYQLTSGQLFWNGGEVHINNAADSQALGINVIHQDRNLIPSFNGVENVYLGLQYKKKPWGQVDWKRMNKRVKALADELNIQIDLSLPASMLKPPEQTLIELLRVLMTDCRLLILDEPTASMTDRETNILFRVIRELKNKRTAVLYVTHRMEEIFQLTDRITVLKNGMWVDTVQTKDVNIENLISLMTDNWRSESIDIETQFGEELLKAKNLSSQDGVVNDVSFSVRAGEIAGVFGLGGSGRTETLECIYGNRKIKSGYIELLGEEYVSPTPARSIQKGMAFISEDRRGMALITSLNVRENITLSTIDDYAHFYVLDDKRQKKDSEDKIESLTIVTTGTEQPVDQLSGGNQQKIVFAKALMSQPQVLLCDEPTQAVDIKTRAEIHRLIRELANQGNAIVFVSSDLKEVLDISDTVNVIANGKTKAKLPNHQLSSEQVLSLCYE
jgi:ribose transport system ATP-binding protein